MNSKKLCLAIASSLVLYAIVSVLVKTNYITLGRVNLFSTQFIQGGLKNNGGLQIKTDAPLVKYKRQDLARVSPRRLSELQQGNMNLEHLIKYNISLSPDCYTINRPVEKAKLILSNLKRKSITQLEAEASIANKRGKAVKRFPTTLIIGVRKGGTRALLAILRLHPQVKSCGPEVHFFDQRYPRGLHWYLDQTPKVGAGQQTIEKTPSYFVVRDVPQRILEYSKAINKSLKFLVIFRDPTVRAVSDYVQLNVGVQTKYNRVLKPFEQLVTKNNTTLEVNTSWGVIKTGVYSKHLERWLRYFPLDWFHFVSGEQLVVNPYVEIKMVEKFLGLKRYFRESNFVFNREKGFPCFRASSSRNERCLGKTKGRAHPTVDPIVLSELRRYYRPFNERLYEMVGRDFHWP